MTATKMNRRPAEGGYSRGDETRRRILDVAIVAFGEHGYDGASTRNIVEGSRSNSAALQYYFGGKDGLFLACAEHLVARSWEGLGEAISLLESAAPDESPEALTDRLCDFFDRQAQFLYSDTGAETWVMFMVREQTNPTPSPAFDLIYERLTKPILTRCAVLVGRIIGRPADDSLTILRTSMVVSQMLAMRVNGQSTLRTLGWPDLKEGRLDLWRGMMRSHARAMLTAPVPPV